MSIAVLSLSPHTGWTNGFSYKTRKAIHAMLQMTGTVLAIIGTATILINNYSWNRTVHGICGKIEHDLICH